MSTRSPLKDDNNQSNGSRYLKRQGSVSFDEVESQREDLAELKRKVEEEIRRDEQKLSFIRDRLGRSAKIEAEMDKTLAQFDERLLLLESSIQPIHCETLKLTRAQENLQTVAGLLREAMHYQGVSREMQKVISAGVSKESLDEYIAAAVSIHDALEHFQTKAAENPEGRTLELMERAALRALEAEFESVLQTESVKSTQEELMAMAPINVLEGRNMLPDDALDALRKITEHMVERQITNVIFAAYSRVRRIIVARMVGEDPESLCSPQRREKTGKRMMNSIRRKSAANLEGGLSPGRQDVPSGIGKRASVQSSTRRGHKRAPSLDKNDLSKGRDTMDPIADEGILYEKGSHPYFVHFSAVLVALQREQALVNQLVPKPLVGQLARSVMNPAMDAVLGKGEGLVGNMSRRSMRGPAGLCLLDILQLFRSKHNEIKGILEVCSSDVGQRFCRLVDSFVQLGHGSLVEQQDYTQGDNTKKLPTDGTVHELTSNTLKYLSALSDYDVVTGRLLGTNGVLPQSDVDDPIAGFVPSEATEDCLVNWFISVLHTLCENLSRKARTYEDQALSAIFLVNNYDHVLKHILASAHIELFRRNDPKIDTRYLSLIQQQRDAYKTATWDLIAAIIKGPFLGAAAGGALSKKEREVIKDKYSGFNESFDATLETQQQYSIPNSELRDQIRQENAACILPLFKAFDDKYRNSGFTVKNPHKYLKYTTGVVEKTSLGLLMKDFFKSK